jgi:hypothetical protein
VKPPNEGRARGGERPPQHFVLQNGVLGVGHLMCGGDLNLEEGLRPRAAAAQMRLSISGVSSYFQGPMALHEEPTPSYIT